MDWRFCFLYNIILLMEDIPAGKSTQSPAEIPSPKKIHNPIGNDSQWSFGWGGN